LNAETPTQSIVAVENENLELSATTPQEMVRCHSAMIAWCDRKIVTIQNEARELSEAAAHAKKNKWKWQTLQRHAEMAEKRVTFYQKFKAALEAGYSVVPNFPVELFAIRTKSKKPKEVLLLLFLRSSRAHDFSQEAKVLPAGEGEYKNPQPVIRTDDSKKQEVQRQGYKETIQPFWAADWDELEFPANMARLHVMDATKQAMDKKIFDEIGMFPADRKRNPDPVIIGRIIDP